MAKKGKYIYDWPRPMVTVDAVVFAVLPKNVKVLLIKRGTEPFKGIWALPGGFVDMDEELEDAAARELAEETGLANVPLQQMHTFGTCGRDPRGRQISVVFMGILTPLPGHTNVQAFSKVKAGDDAAKAKWFDIDKLPARIAFDHNQIAEMAIKKLKRKRIYQQAIKS